MPDSTIRFARDGLAQLASQLSQKDRARIAGLGIAMPFRLWEWAQSLGVPETAMAEWRKRDVKAELAEVAVSRRCLKNDIVFQEATIVAPAFNMMNGRHGRNGMPEALVRSNCNNKLSIYFDMQTGHCG